MKLLGAMLIFASFCYAGAVIWKERKRRLTVLRKLCFSLELTASELSGRLCPLPELTALLAFSKGSAVEFYSELNALMPQLGSSSLSELWAAAAEKTLKCLSADELEEFIRLGQFLGKYEIAEQLAAVQACLSFFRIRRDAAQSGSAEERRLSLGVTAAAGALAAIMFM